MFKKFTNIFSDLSPPRILILGYLSYALIGWLLLLLPFCHYHPISSLDDFFISTSAMSTTGLATIDVGTSYTLVGQIVIFMLIQAGGIGYMTFSSFVILATTNKLSSYRHKMASSTFSLPKGFSVKEFIYHVIIFTFLCEIIGAIILTALFMNKGIQMPIWYGIFHSVSAFCTAGFSLFSDSFIHFKYDLGINITLSVLSLLGALGFIVWLDLYKKYTGQKEQITFVSKVILSVTCAFMVFGTLIFFLLESPFSDTFYHKIITSFFQTMTASTTVGFNTLDIGSLKTSTIVLLLFLMVFGASPSGTGGGLKSTTFAALVGLVKSTVSGKGIVSFWKREIPLKRVRLATATFAYYMFVLTIAIFCLAISENKPFLPMLFEIASALGTVGLSMGITSELTEFGKFFISFLMLMGRVGILTFGVALSVQEKDVEKYQKEHLVF